ncbi:mCG145942, partial [Mus musculus]
CHTLIVVNSFLQGSSQPQNDKLVLDKAKATFSELLQPHGNKHWDKGIQVRRLLGAAGTKRSWTSRWRHRLNIMPRKSKAMPGEVGTQVFNKCPITKLHLA